MNKDHLHPEGRPYTKEEFIEKIKSDRVFAEKFANLGPIYGKQWRHWTNRAHYLESRKIVVDTYTDQIANLISELKTNPDSRRLMVNAWNVADLPVTDYGRKHITEGKMVLPPCHYGFQVYTRELTHEERYHQHFLKFKDRCTADCYSKEDFDKKGVPSRAISLMWNQRSVDVGLGLPFNIASYALLLEIIAKHVNMIPEELIGNLGDCHIYNNHIDGLKEQLTRTSFELPKLKMNPIFLANLEHKTLDDAINGQVNFELENYQSHPAIKLPLSN